MKTFALAALIVAISQAIALQNHVEDSIEPVNQQLSQLLAETETETNSMQPGTATRKPHKGSHDDDDNTCKCALDACPGLLQIPGACEELIDRD